MSDDRIVEFKSFPEHYEKEKNGIRISTYRYFEGGEKPTDERFKRLFDGTAKLIQIRNSITEEAFLRQITDVAIYGFDMCIISWRDDSKVSKKALLSDAAVEAGDKRMREGGLDSNGNKCYGFNYKNGLIAAIQKAEEATKPKGDD